MRSFPLDQCLFFLAPPVVVQIASIVRAWTSKLTSAQPFFAVVLAVPGLCVLERAGPQELIDAEVISTTRWRHFAADGASHSHTAATLQIEGLSETSLERADGYERGQRVPVWIQRGRISGWPYFLDVAKPGEIERERSGGGGRGVRSRCDMG